MLDLETIEHEARIAVCGYGGVPNSTTQIALVKLLVDFGIQIAKRADQKHEYEERTRP